MSQIDRERRAHAVSGWCVVCVEDFVEDVEAWSVEGHEAGCDEARCVQMGRAFEAWGRGLSTSHDDEGIEAALARLGARREVFGLH